MLKFKAVAISASELPDLNCFSIVLAEERDGSGRRLEIQRALEFDAQDRDLGQDTYCVCTDEGAVHYGGISSWSLVDRELKIVLDPSAAETLGVEDGFWIELDADLEAQLQLKGALLRALNMLD